MQLDNGTKNAMLTAAVALLNGGGSLQITTAADAVISTHSLSNTAFSAPANGVATANAIGSAKAVAGTAAKYRIRSADNTIRMWGEVQLVPDGQTPPPNVLGLIMVNIPAGLDIEISSLTLTVESI